MAPKLDKRRFPTPTGFPQHPVPVGALYLLSEGTVGTSDLAGAEALVELVRHSYAVDLLRASRTQGRHFSQCAALAEAVPVRRLGVGASVDEVLRLPAVVAADLS